MIQRLISERRVSSGDVSRYVDEMRREIDDLERRLQSLREAHGGGVGSGGGGFRSTGSGSTGTGAGSTTGRRRGRPPGSGRAAQSGSSAQSSSAQGGSSAQGTQSSGGGAKRGRKAGRRGGAALSPEQLASRQLQGRYLALVRQIPAKARAQYAKIAKERGREAAIKEMSDTLKK